MSVSLSNSALPPQVSNHLITEKTLRELLDLALGTPEVGAVNFNLLHTLLSSMLQKLDLQNVVTAVNKDQIREDASNMALPQSKVSETQVETKPSSSQVDAQQSRSLEMLDKKITEMENQLEVLNSLPSNQDLIDKAKSGTAINPAADVWQQMQLQKKVDTNEAGVTKSLSLIDDLLQEMRKLQDKQDKMKMDINRINHEVKKANDMSDVLSKLETMDELENSMNNLQRMMDGLQEKLSKYPDADEFETHVTWPILEEVLSQRMQQLENIRDSQIQPSYSEDGQTGSAGSPGPVGSSGLPGETGLFDPTGVGSHTGLTGFNGQTTTSEQGDDRSTVQDERDDAVLVPPTPGTTPPHSRPTSSHAPSSRPNSSRAPSSRLASAKEKYPQATEMLERIGALSLRQDELMTSVTVLQETMPTKADKLDIERSMQTIGPVIPDDLLDQLEKLKESLLNLEKEKDRIRELLTMQQESIDSILSMRPAERAPPTPGAAISEGESSGYESAGGAGVSSIELRKLELQCQRLGQKMTGHVKQLQQTDDDLDTTNKKIKLSVDDVALRLQELQDNVDMIKDLQKSFKNDSKATGSSDLQTIVSKSSLVDATASSGATSAKSGATNARGGISDTKGKTHDTLQPNPPSVGRPSIPKRLTYRKQDSDAVTNIQNALLNLQAEMEKLHELVNSALEEHTNKQKHIDALYGYVEKMEENKADKENVRKEFDVKADKQALVSKVSRSDFDTATNEITKNLDELVEKIVGQESEWQKAVKKLSSDVDGKLDRMELESLKQHLENRLKAMRKLLEQRPQKDGYPEGDDAAGFRKQLLQSYNCISCDRPVELGPAGPYPSIPATPALTVTKSVRPYTSFELDQIRQQARGWFIGKNAANFKAALEERDIARMRKLDEMSFRAHYPQGPYQPGIGSRYPSKLPAIPYDKLLRKIREENEEGVVPAGRACGGNYTLTYPHRRYTRLTHLSELWQDEETVIDVAREEVELQGHDGHIYKGRLPTIPPQVQFTTTTIRKFHGPSAPDSGYPPHSGGSPRPGSARSAGRQTANARRPTSGTNRPRTPGMTPPHLALENSHSRSSATATAE